MDLYVFNDSNPVASPDVGNSDIDVPNIESTAEHIYTVSPARSTRSLPLSPALSGAEEEAELPSASTQEARRYECYLERLDGSGPCQRSFNRQSELSRHRLGSAHKPAMPCPFCARSWKVWYQQRLLAHVKKWHPEKIWTEFRCSFCTKTPHSYKSLVSHVTVAHSDMPLEARTRATRGF